MNGIARNFFIAALVFGLLGLLLGLHMAMSQDHAPMPTHAHVMVIGWLSFAIFAFFYHLFPQVAQSLATRIHYWLAIMSMVVMVIGLSMLLGGNTSGEPLAAVLSIAYLISYLFFAWAAWPVLRTS